MIIALSMAIVAMTAAAQNATYFHDEAVMNQFTVAETGLGNLGAGSVIAPGHYWLWHKSYKQEAAGENKAFYRLWTYYSWHKEKPYAEEIDSCLKERAKIEAYNLIDRQVDLAWALEQKKIENKKAVFLRNINRISTMGGTAEDYKRWLNIYNAIECGLRNVKDAYMPNSERQKSYLLIYKDLVKYNTDLSALLADLYARRGLKGFETAQTPVPRTSVAQHAAAAFRRWKAAWHGAGNTATHGQGIEADF